MRTVHFSFFIFAILSLEIETRATSICAQDFARLTWPRDDAPLGLSNLHARSVGRKLIKYFSDRQREHPSRRNMQALLGGQPFDRILVITHQSDELAESTGEFMRELDPEMPRVLLVSEVFTPGDDLMIQQATTALYSVLGEVEVPFNADTFHLAGGNASVCLQKTVRDLTASALSYRSRSRVEMVLHSDIIFDACEKSEDLGQKIEGFRSNLSSREKRAIHFAWNMLEDRKFLRQTEYKPLARPSLSDRGLTIEFLRRRDSKIVVMTFTESKPPPSAPTP